MSYVQSGMNRLKVFIETMEELPIEIWIKVPRGLTSQEERAYVEAEVEEYCDDEGLNLEGWDY
jgi:hypothetical protein